MPDASPDNPKPLRVLHLGKYYPPFKGGIEQFMRDLMLAQRRRGDDIRAIVHHHETGRATVDEDVEGVPIRRVRIRGRLMYAPVPPTFGRELRSLIGSFKPDVLHLHMPNVSAFCALLSGAAKQLPWVTHWHSDVVFSQVDRRVALAYRGYRPFEKRVLKRSGAIIATSPPYLESSEALQAHRDRCHVVPLGVDRARLPEPSEDDRAWARTQWSGDAVRVLTIGRLTYYKGHRYLLDAIARTPGVSACIAGRGDQQDALRKQADALSLGDRVMMQGFVSDAQLLALLAECDVFCLPSLERTEAFGVVLMEAMRFGKPLLVCDIAGSGVTWVARHDDNGLVVPTANADALAGALTKLRDDPDMRSRLGHGGRQRYDSEFDIDRVAQAIDGVYRSCLM